MVNTCNHVNDGCQRLTKQIHIHDEPLTIMIINHYIMVMKTMKIHEKMLYR